MNEEKIEVVIKDELFKKIGLVVDKCSASTEDSDSCVRIFGIITCEGDWDDEYCLKIKANLYNTENDIIHIGYDYEMKTFRKIDYESFSVCCLKGNDCVKYVEIYPKLVKASSVEEI